MSKYQNLKLTSKQNLIYFSSLCAGSNDLPSVRNSERDGDYREKKNWLEFVSIECPTYEIALQVDKIIILHYILS